MMVKGRLIFQKTHPSLQNIHLRSIGRNQLDRNFFMALSWDRSKSAQAFQPYEFSTEKNVSDIIYLAELDFSYHPSIVPEEACEKKIFFRCINFSTFRFSGSRGFRTRLFGGFLVGSQALTLLPFPIRVRLISRRLDEGFMPGVLFLHCLYSLPQRPKTQKHSNTFCALNFSIVADFERNF